MRIAKIDTADGPMLFEERDGLLQSLDRRDDLACRLLGGGRGNPGQSDGRGRLLPPVAPRKIVAVGLNYRDHIREAGMTPPAAPLVFTKFTSSLTGPNDPIVIDPEITQRVDWEVELAVVVGRRMRRVSERAALDHVFGYTVANDVSARDLQFGDGQWVRGKSLDTFCPIGPCVVTADDVPDPQNLALRTRVNGRTVQDSSTRDMVFGIADLLAYCSRSFTLEPGDVLLTGTPWGCGEFMEPPRSLQPGDVVEAEVSAVGCLRNEVRSLAYASQTYQ